MTVIPFPSRWPAPRCPLETDALADLIFSLVLDREAELQALVDAGHHVRKELDAVQALLRLILSPNVRMPLSRLQ